MPIRLLSTVIILSTVVLVLIIGPLVVPIAELDTVPAADLATSTSQFIDLAGYTLHYDQRHRLSEAEVVVSETPTSETPTSETPITYVLLHGFIGNTFAWRQVLDTLTKPIDTDTTRASGGVSSIDVSGVDELNEPAEPAEPASTTVANDVASTDGTTVADVQTGDVHALAYDRLGFGLSARPLRGSWPQGENPYAFDAQQTRLLELTTALELEGKLILVGHDTGAALALALAERNPEQFAGVILIAPVPEVTSNVRGLWQLLYRTPQIDRLGPLFMRQLASGPGQEMLRSSLPDPESITAEVIAGYRQNTQVDNWDKSLWELSRASATTLSPARTPKDMPVMIIASRDDQLVPFASSQALARDLAAPLVTLEGCGHLPQEACPQALTQAMTTWVAEAVDVP
jgi:pimeloyl-ACP methyl ester carboxylesterase